MDEKDFKAILFSYENKDRILYQYYAEFFKLIGVYVCQNVKYPNQSIENIEKYNKDFNICYDIDDHINITNLYMLKSLLEECFDEKYFDGWYNQLVEIYERHQLLQASITIDSYNGCSELLDAGNSFDAAVTEIIALIEKNPEYANNRHILYAKLYCKYKASIANYFSEGWPLYFFDDLQREGLSLLEKYPNFSNARVLVGDCCKNCSDLIKDSVDAYGRAIKMEKNKSYVSNIYYCLGVKCFDYNCKEQYKSIRYQALLESNHSFTNYQKNFKIAKTYLDDENFEKALFYCEISIKQLEQTVPFSSPLEQICYYDLLKMMSYIYLKLKDCYHCIQTANKALSFREKILSGIDNCNEYTDFYYKVYPIEKANNYIRLTLKSMDQKKLYCYMASAYGQAQMDEESSKYWKLYRR